MFAGIGGFRSALEQNNHECVAFAEIDKYARQSYKALYNTEGEDEYHDVTEVTDEQWREYRGRVDLITAGLPCQPFSISGRRQGFEDTRGTLFYDVARAAKEIQPRYILIENVQGLLSSQEGKNFETILNTLDGLGFYVEWNLFNSKTFGISQSRKRVFILATRKDVFTKPKLFDIVEDVRDSEPPELSTILEKDVLESFYIRDELFDKLVVADRAPDNSLTDKLPIREGTKVGFRYAEVGDSVGLLYSLSDTRRGRVGKKIANTLQSQEVNQGVVVRDEESGKLRIRRLTPLEFWRLQGFTDEQFYKAKDAGVSNFQLYTQAGNAVSVPVIKKIIDKLEEC